MNTQKEECSCCRFYHFHNRFGHLCRKCAPVAGVRLCAGVAITEQDSWCGEFERIETDEKKSREKIINKAIKETMLKLLTNPLVCGK
ncbi:hypothetical protein LCGC14_1895850 [marine sediment metagenome]|uniref:Uncharacterized protein n=1 Tax=marine sediment metagenome TaxID=412755 RepID=A0A0F9IW77_9ZZZZ